MNMASFSPVSVWSLQTLADRDYQLVTSNYHCPFKLTVALESLQAAIIGLLDGNGSRNGRDSSRLGKRGGNSQGSGQVEDTNGEGELHVCDVQDRRLLEIRVCLLCEEYFLL